MLTSAEQRLTRACSLLETSGFANGETLPPLISQSWERCLAAGLDPQSPPPLIHVTGADLARAREQTGALRGLALAEMEQLYEQIAGTNYMVAFASPDGMLLDTIADTTFLDAAKAARIASGTIWQERHCGTNALGTTAVLREPVTVHGAEHFFTSHRMLTCTAAPVFDPDGNLAGVLDASSDYRSRQQHTRALVAMAATQIENGLLRDRHGKQMLISFHSRGEYLHTLSAGLLAVDADGCILAANAQARFLLQGLPATKGRHFDDVFRTRLRDVIDAARASLRTQIEDRVGSIYAARLENAPPRTFVAKAVRTQPEPTFVATDPLVADIVAQVALAAQRKIPILIRGATGTGKEQLARHAHAASGRTGKFVPVNCAALPETLAEAELFGHTEGAFTGARRGGAPGLIVEAHGGTLFLDEIGDMKAALQSLLLRFLDDWTVRSVGGGRPREVDVLLVSATNIDIEQAIAVNRFRADLFYRLGGVDVALPPLSARTDLARIAERLLARIDADLTLAPDAADALAAHAWPGNIRELRSVLTRLGLAPKRPILGAEDVAAVLNKTASRLPPYPNSVPDGPLQARSVDLRSLLRARVRETHAAAAGNVSETARRLGVSRNTVYRALADGGAAR